MAQKRRIYKPRRQIKREGERCRWHMGTVAEKRIKTMTAYDENGSGYKRHDNNEVGCNNGGDEDGVENNDSGIGYHGLDKDGDGAKFWE